MPIDFPNSPNNGDSFTSNDKTWQYNGTSWVVIAGSVSIDAGSVTASKLANNAVTNAKIDTGAVHSVNIAADSVTSAKIDTGAVTAAKIAADAVTTAKILDANITTAKVAANAITQAKLASNVTGITITTTANRSTDIPSPFTAQFIFLTDTNTLQRWNGSAWVSAVALPPAAPTALSGTALSTTSVSIAFSPGADNGATITNYEYALSTNSGSTYGSFLALDPADATSPITISGLSAGTAYTIKLKAVNTMGASGESAGVSVTTNFPLGFAQNVPASSAKAILAETPNAASGIYWLNDGVDTFQCYCDMTRNGGGWMLVASIRGGNSNEVMNTGAAGLTTPVYQPSSTANWGKFSDARINRIRARSQSQANGYTGNWPWWMEGVGYSGGDIQNFVYKDAVTFSVNTLPESDSIWRRITNTYNEASATYDSTQVPNSGTKGWGMHHQSDASRKRSCWARHPESGGSCAWQTDSWGIPTYGHVWVK